MEGVKKPEQAIFDLTLRKLGVKAHEAVFLDDLGRNLKTARLMGMTTIKVRVRTCACDENTIQVLILMTLYQVTDVVEAVLLLEQFLDHADHTHPLHIPGTSDVSPKLQLPTDRLASYLQERHGLGQKGEEPVLKQFRHGQSNPTYYLLYGGQEMVLRKKPVRGGKRKKGKEKREKGEEKGGRGEKGGGGSFKAAALRLYSVRTNFAGGGPNSLAFLVHRIFRDTRSAVTPVLQNLV